MLGDRISTRRRTGFALALIAGILASAYTVRTVTALQAPAEGYGAQLFLVSPAADQFDELAALPASVHATVYSDPAESYVASGDQTVVARAAELGLAVEVLDADTAGKAYYFVDAQAENARQLAEQFGAIIFSDATQHLLAVPAANEAPLLDALPVQGVSVALLPPYSITVTAPLSLAQAAAAPEAADASIADLLVQVSSTDIAGYIGDLSGERAVDIGGATATLLTRYTFATTISYSERYLHQRYVELGIPVSYAPWTYGSYSGRNVVAELRGSLHPERIWLVGGHFDSTSESPYTRAPGADDNASGTAATLELAGILKNYRFADTIRFVHFSAEEQGHWGSLIYARGLSAAGAQVMGYIDLDMIGWDGDGDRTMEIHSGTRANSISLAARFTSANLRYGQGLRVEVKQGSASRFSDHSSFWDYGYASFLAIENFFDDAIARDRNPWYHNTGDLPGHVNLDYVVRTARVSLAMLAEDAGIIDPGVTVTPTATPTGTATPGPGTCTELVVNGSFEGSTAWTFASTANRAAYSTAQAHGGTRSVRLGVAPSATGVEDAAPQDDAAAAGGTNLLGEMAPLGASYSTAYQTITVPAAATRVTLAFWRLPGTIAAGGDFQRAMLLRPGTYAVIATVFKSLTNATAWQPVSFDLTPYRGQSIVLYFEVYNDDILSGPRTWMYLDDVSAQACSGAVPTATATVTASPTVQAIATATPTATATGVATNTPTATAEPTLTPTATPTTPSACTQYVANGGFESNAAWTFAQTGNPGGYSTAQAHSRLRSARLGIVAVAGASEGDENMQQPSVPERNLFGELAPLGASYSTAYQTINLPAGANALTLKFWYRPGTQATTGNTDFQRAMLLKPGSYAVIKTLVKMLSNAGQWQTATYDLTAYRGQSVVLYFEVYNDNTTGGARTWMYVDDVSVEACRPEPLWVGAGPLLPRVWLPMVVKGQ